ncbi:MAG: spore coat U domain-containing protein [Methylobacter sp.]|nr:spore coat U domain-containing protein [Methylobacter sp.]
MKKCRNHPFKKIRLGNPRPRQGNSFFNLTAALLGVVLSLTSTPAAAVGLNCSVSATGVAFGNYNPTNSSSTDATGNVHVFCTVLLVSVGAQTNISLNTGGSGSFASRKMSSGANRLNYNLYKEASHTTVWGDGTGGTGIFTDNTLIAVLGTSINHTIYGSIPASQFVAAGSYSDTITVTVEFHEVI